MHLPRPLLRSQNRRVRLRLNLRHNRLNLTRRLLRPLRQLPHLRRHHRKPTPMLTRPSRLNRRIQRQQIRLISQLINHLQNPTNLLTLLPQPQRPRPQSDPPERNRSIAATDAATATRPCSANPNVSEANAATCSARLRNLSRRRRQLLNRRRRLRHRRRLLRRRQPPAPEPPPTPAKQQPQSAPHPHRTRPTKPRNDSTV